MATKPADLPRWADGGSADVVEPSSGKKDIGWVAGEKLPAQFFNWILEKIYDWMVYLDDGIIQHAAKIKQVSSMEGIAPSGGTNWVLSQTNSGGAGNGSKWITPTAAGVIVSFPIKLEAGQRLLKVRAFIQDTTGGSTIDMKVWENSNVDGNVQVGSTQTSAGDASQQTLELDLTGGSEHTIADDRFYTINLRTSSGTAGTHEIYGLEIEYDRVTS